MSNYFSFSSSSSSSSSASQFLTAAASVAATTMLVRTIAHDILPEEFEGGNIYAGFRSIKNYFSNQFTMVIEECSGLVANEIYLAAEIYLGARVPCGSSSSSSRRLKVDKTEKEKMVVRMDEGEEIKDVFDGAVFRWRLISKRLSSSSGGGGESRQVIVVNSSSRAFSSDHHQIKLFNLSFHKKHKQMVLDKYLPHILKESKSIKEKNRTLKIFTTDSKGVWGDGDIWIPMQLDHPSNFDTLAMDSNLKKTIMEDLERFVRRKDFYRRVGKAWKRGYLLYGPPGTGKSSLIAAMANYLNFDVYDLELTELQHNSELRSILLATANRSILVLEDIDCSVDFQDRAENMGPGNNNNNKKVITLSGLLNFIDGLWSCAGDERIIVFTTNHKEKLDPALLRPGRMDMHIHMSYCTPCGFRTLASNYLQIQEHHLFEEIESCIEKTEVTPAEIGEELMKDDDPEIVLSGLVEFLHKKKIEHDEAAKVVAAKEADEKAKAKDDNKEEAKLNC